MSMIKFTLEPVKLTDFCDRCTEENCSLEIQVARQMAERMECNECPGYKFLSGNIEWADILHIRKLELVRQGGGHLLLVKRSEKEVNYIC